MDKRKFPIPKRRQRTLKEALYQFDFSIESEHLNFVADVNGTGLRKSFYFLLGVMRPAESDIDPYRFANPFKGVQSKNLFSPTHLPHVIGSWNERFSLENATFCYVSVDSRSLL
jgi:hypothetical protein